MKKKPCSVCQTWFRPHARLGARQRTRGDEACRREQHRRTCVAGRAVNRVAAHERRLRARLVDETGNRTTYSFSNVRRNQGLPEGIFAFEPPPGTELVDER